jgi:lipid II:glycine glycyltransferase (peptidoglycan interpeptide bridge formation enzyme)
MLFLIHGQTATYHIGWQDEAGRDAGAHPLLLWRAMGMLAERGVRWLDLGGVDTGPGAGIARFKLGTGGQVLTLPGTFV